MRVLPTPLLFMLCCACVFATGDAFQERAESGAVRGDACGSESESSNSSGGPGGDAVAVAEDGEDAGSVARGGRDGASSRSIDIRIGDEC